MTEKKCYKVITLEKSGIELMLAIFFILVLAFTFAFGFWYRLFTELDYFEIKYTKQTKKRVLGVIFGNLLSLIGLFYMVHLVLSRLAP